jgi:hypothetical protein
MINLKAFIVGLGFLLAILIFVVHKLRLRAAHKKRIAEIKNRRKKKKKRKN